MLLTQKTDIDEQPAGDINVKDLYRSQWKRVQHLAGLFWSKWRRDDIQTLQVRRKWNKVEDNIRVGDIVMLKNNDVGINCWPIGHIITVYPSADGLVRKSEICITKCGERSTYIRPVVNMVPLISTTDT